MEQAIQLVMEFHNVSREDAVNLYWDEVEAAMRLLAAGMKTGQKDS
jgi:NACalpha-BTF3-like transcription factor